MGDTNDEFEYVFVKWITLRNGVRLYAHSVGLNAFRIKVRKR